MKSPPTLEHRTLGRAGGSMSILGLGTRRLAAAGQQATIRAVRAAIDRGVNVLEIAPEYADGRAERWIGLALRDGYRERVQLIWQCCAHLRDYKTAMLQLESTLQLLRTERVDLWSFHEVIYDNDPDWIYDHGGLDAAQEACEQGKARWVGFHGEKSPHIALKLIARGFAWDAVLMPLNPFDASFRSFEKQVLPEVIRRGGAVIGTKPLAGGTIPGCKVVKVEEAYRYVWSLPVSSVLAGADSPELLKKTIRLALAFKPFHAGEMDAVRQKARIAAGDGRFERYKTTQESDVIEHGFEKKKRWAAGRRPRKGQPHT
jgi:predicted aldo/keto reductase-like oxidoreductase